MGHPTPPLGVDRCSEDPAVEQFARHAAKLDAVLSATRALVFEADAETFEVTFVSPAAAVVFGYAAEEWVGSASIWSQLIHPDDAPRVLRECGAAAAAGRAHVLEYRVRTRDGRILWVQDRTEYIAPVAGQRALLRGILVDITEQKQRELAREAHLTLFHRLIENMPSAVLVETVDRKIFTANKNLCALFAPGFEPTDLVGADCRELTASFSEMFVVPESFSAGVDEAIERGATVTGERLHLRDGRCLSRDYVPISTETGAFAGHMWQFTDVTQSTRAAERLQASERKFRQLFDYATDAVFLVEQNGAIVDVNQRACETLGYTRAELMALHVSDIEKAIDASGRGAFCEALTAGNSVTVQGSHRRKDGFQYPVEMRVTRFELDGRHLHLATARDITERRQLEDQLGRAQKMEAVGQLAGGIAHDFNNILTSIEGAASLLLDQVGPESDLIPDLELIRSAGKRAAELIRHLLAFSRRQILQPERVSPPEVVRQAETLLRRVIRENVRLTIDCPIDVADVLVDRVKLESALLNLVINGRDAMPDGGSITIGVKPVTVPAHLAASHWFIAKPGTYIVISVADTGHGIAAEIREKIFEPFFTTKGPGEGTGLGLSMVYGFVRQSGGFVGLQSAVGEGTTFYIALPSAQRDPSPERPRGAAVAASQEWRTGTVLVVEDDPSVLTIIRRALASKGLTVLEATNGVDALQVLARHPADLVISDAVMPLMGGLALAQQLRARGSRMPILLVSGYASGVEQALETLDGPIEFLQKPLSPGDVFAMVSGMLGN